MVNNPAFFDVWDDATTTFWGFEIDWDQTEEDWALIARMEEDYDCTGMCDAGLWYLTRPLSDGMPANECLKPVMDDVKASFKAKSSGVGVFLLISALCQIMLFGGIVARAEDVKDDEKADFDNVEGNQDEEKKANEIELANDKVQN